MVATYLPSTVNSNILFFWVSTMPMFPCGVMQTSLTETIASLNGTITELNGKIASMTEAYENRISDLENEINVKQAELDAAGTKISELETTLEKYDSNYIEATIVNSENKNPNTMPAITKDTDTLHNIELNSKVLEQVNLSSYFKVKQISNS